LIEVANSSLHTADLIILNDQIPTDPDGNVTVTIKDADTNTVIRSGTATNVEDDDGHFSFQLKPSDTYIDRVLLIEWSYTQDSDEVVEKEFINVATPYASPGEIVDELGLGVESSDVDYFPYERLKTAERLARIQINNYTGKNFGKRIGSQTIYGKGSDTLIFQEQMLAFTKVEQDDIVRYDSTIDYNTFGFGLTLTETGQGLRILNSNQLDVQDNQSPPTLYWDPIKYKFKDNSRFKVYGTIGYNYVPSEIKQAAFLLINDHLHNDALWRQKYIDEIDTGQMKFKMRDGAFSGTGNLIVDDILDAYKAVGIVVI